ncbi:MAG: isochorismatase family protein [Lentisphaeria bacterium]|nr:isochorismatase family protein [Lentisphaeria bacterium]
MKFPTVENAALVMIDMQQKLLPAMNDPQKVLERNMLMLNGVNELGLDVIVTEQYPKGLGATVPELSGLLKENTPVIAKTSFSVFGSSEFCTALAARRREVLIFCGVEAHVCLLQSVFDALEQDYEVIVVADAVNSRKSSDQEWALQAMRDHGATVLPGESVLFMLLRDAGNPVFKAVSKLVK